MPDPAVTVELGTDKLVGLVNSLGDIVELGTKAFADGLQITDVMYLPQAIGVSIGVVSNLAGAIAEAKDLSIEETGQVLEQLVARLLKLFVGTK